MRDINTVEALKKLRKEFTFYAKHAIRRHNEFVLLKCQFFREPEEVCGRCRDNPSTAIKTLELMKKNDGKLFAPTRSSTHEDHYHTFLEMMDMIPVEEEMDDSELGACEICPSWRFTSNAEIDRHKKILHPFETMGNVTNKRKFICNWKTQDETTCGEVFDSSYKLQKHKEAKGHKRSRSENANEKEKQRKKDEYAVSNEAMTVASK